MSWLNCFYTITGKVIIINKSYNLFIFFNDDKERIKWNFEKAIRFEEHIFLLPFCNFKIENLFLSIVYHY